MQAKAREFIRWSIGAALYHSGVAWLACMLLLRRRAIVLMYHRVLPSQPRADAFSADAITVADATFDRHMRFLRRFFHPLTTQEFHAMLSGTSPWRPRACLVTFDDGWFDNADHALPVLERQRVPAVVFLATGFVDTASTFWQEWLTRLLFAAWQLGPRSHALFSQLESAEILDLEERSARIAIRHLVTRLKARTREQIDALIRDTEQHLRTHEALPANCGDDRFMTWKQATRMLDSGLVAIGSHAHSHAPLTSLDSNAVREELQQAHQHLSSRLKLQASTFAYPNGNYDDSVVTQVREAGYQLAFTTDSGWVQPGDNLLRLKRINIGERGTDTNAGFLCRLLRWL